MNKEKVIKEVNNKLENITQTEAKEIIINIIEKMPKVLYEKVICIIDNTKGNLDISSIDYVKPLVPGHVLQHVISFRTC